jgi:sporulation protein YlmC with PRC-barrel domain
MKRHLIATVSSIAIVFGAASLANAADKTMEKTTQPGTTSAQSEMNKGPATKDRSATDTRTRNADTALMRSYDDNKDTLMGVTMAGGLSPEKLIGANVVNASGDEIGEIHDLAVDPDNKISHAIVEVGGFLGIGSKFVAVEVDQLQANAAGDGYMSTLTKEELETNAEYTKEDGHWMQSYK